MAESKRYYQKGGSKVSRGQWVRITDTKKRKHVGKVLSVDGGYPVVVDGRTVGYQYGLEISGPDGEGYGLSWKQWLEPGQGGTSTDGGTFAKIKRQ